MHVLERQVYFLTCLLSFQKKEIIWDFLKEISSCPGISRETKICFCVVTWAVFHFFFLPYIFTEMGHIGAKSQHCALLMVWAGFMSTLKRLFLHHHLRQRMTFVYHQHKPFQEAGGTMVSVHSFSLIGCYRWHVLSRCKELFPGCKWNLSLLTTTLHNHKTQQETAWPSLRSASGDWSPCMALYPHQDSLSPLYLHLSSG